MAGGAAACTGDTPPTTGGSGPKPTPIAATPPAGPADWNAFARVIDGTLIRPTNAGYELAKRNYIPAYDTVRPAAIAYCENAGDVAECISFAARMRLPLSVRCGGHNYAGWSTGSGLIIDVSPMDSLRVDGTRAVLGAGTRLIDAYDGLAGHGLAVPAGTCPTVGLAGLTLGGGLGVRSREHGLTCDALESVTVVTVDGKARKCDAHHDPDLFWACRGGGGGNFGVAVEFGFHTHKATPLTTFSLQWPWSRAAEVVRGWQRWAPSAPDEIWTSLQFTSAPASVRISGVAPEAPDLGGLIAAIGAEPSGRDARSRTHMDAMKAMGGCAGQSTAACHAQGELPGQRVDGQFPRTDYAGKSHLAYRPLTDAAIATLVGQFSNGDGTPGRAMLMDAMGGAIARVPPTATAFPHRRALFCVQYNASGTDREWLRATHAAMEPHLGGAAYVNYMDPDLKNWQRAYYGPNLDRLVRLKAAYDPASLFRFPQSVRL